MAPADPTTQKRPPGLVRSLSQRFLRAGRNSPANNGAPKGDSPDVSTEGKKRVGFKRPEGTVRTMRAIVEPRKEETLSYRESGAHIKRSLVESEKRVSTLRYILDDFTTALTASSRDEARERERRMELAKIQQRQNQQQRQQQQQQRAEKDLPQPPPRTRVPRHDDVVASLKQQAALSEREMCALLTELSSTQDEIDSYQSEIAALNDNIAAIAATSQDLARKNKGLAQHNTVLHQRLSQLDSISEVAELEGSVRGFGRWGRQASTGKPKVAVEEVRVHPRSASQGPKRRRLVF